MQIFFELIGFILKRDLCDCFRDRKRNQLRFGREKLEIRVAVSAGVIDNSVRTSTVVKHNFFIVVCRMATVAQRAAVGQSGRSHHRSSGTVFTAQRHRSARLLQVHQHLF